jgi:hypothetical protein
MLRIIVICVGLSVIFGSLFEVQSSHWNVPLHAARARLSSQWDKSDVQRQHTILIPEID